MLSVEDAVALLASRLGVVEGSESIRLVQADGRVLAQDVTAPLPLPPFTNSAVDGYALRGEDLPVGAEKMFPVVDWVQAGAAADEVKDFYAQGAWETWPSTPAELTAEMHTAYDKWGAMVKQIGRSDHAQHLVCLEMLARRLARLLHS